MTKPNQCIWPIRTHYTFVSTNDHINRILTAAAWYNGLQLLPSYMIFAISRFIISNSFFKCKFKITSHWLWFDLKLYFEFIQFGSLNQARDLNLGHLISVSNWVKKFHEFCRKLSEFYDFCEKFLNWWKTVEVNSLTFKLVNVRTFH